MKKSAAKHVQALNVSLDGRPVGTLAQDADRSIWFEYAPQWIADGFDLAPKHLAFDTRPQIARAKLFQGLHGVFSDSLPDGWGLLLMDREFKRRFGWDAHTISPLDRLAYMGSRPMGALEYAPVYPHQTLSDEIDLAALSRSAEAVLAGDEGEVLQALLIQGGSPGGARPKVTIARTDAASRVLSGFQTLPPGYAHWIVKFRGKEDPLDMGRIERAYADMAQLAGVQMPRTELIAVDTGGASEHYFAAERFDRAGQAGKRHMLSLAGYLYADFRLPCMDYDDVLKVVSMLTRDRTQVTRAFRLMVFNALAHNRDDHVKNFAFVVDEQGDWKLSPAFDLTFSTGMSGQHTTAIGGHGTPSPAPMLKIAANHHIANAEQIIGEVRHAISLWPALANKWAVSAKSAAMIQEALTGIDKAFTGVAMRPHDA